MSYLRLPIGFPSHAAILVLRCPEIGPPKVSIGDVLYDYRDLVDEKSVEVFGKMVIMNFRPDLKGAILEGYDFDMREFTHKFYVSHPSLPAVIPGMPLEYIDIGSASREQALRTIADEQRVAAGV